jgi:hypothetical protein
MDAREVKYAMFLQESKQMILARQESGLTVKQWCKANGLSENTYYYRTKRLRHAAIAEKMSGIEMQQHLPTLVKVEMSPEQARFDGATMKLTISSGTLEIPVGTKADAITEVLKAMQSCAV